MTGDLVAVRLVEDVDGIEEGAGGLARYALYGGAAVAALIGAWLVAGPSANTAPAPAPIAALTAHTTELPVSNIRQIVMTQRATTDAASAADVASPTSTVGASSPPASPHEAQTSALDQAPLPPKPVPRPACGSSCVTTAQAAGPVAATAPAVRVAPAPSARVEAAASQPVAATPASIQTGAPPRDLGVLREPVNAGGTSPAYVSEPRPAMQQPAASYQPAGPVPPMPVDDTLDVAPPPGTPIQHQGLLGASERAVGTAWNWTTGTVNGLVRGVQNGF